MSGEGTTFLLAGLLLTLNDQPIRGTDVYLTRGTHTNGSLIQNTLGRKIGTYLVDIDYTGTPPFLDLSYNGWQQDGVAAFPDEQWFCVRNNGSDCIDKQVDFAPATEGFGCGNVPQTCPDPPCVVDPCGSPDKPCLPTPATGTAATLRVWPNPNAGANASVGFAAGGGRLSVVDVLGRELYATPIDEAQEFIELPTVGLAPATYFVHLLRDDGTRSTQSFVVVRP